jgi:hypothetical protein
VKPTEEIRFRALREGVFAYLAWVPAEGYEWRSDLKPWPPRQAGPPQPGGEVVPVSVLPRWIDRDPPPDPPPYLVGPTPPGVPTLMHPRGLLREGRHRNDGLHHGLHRRFAGLVGIEQIKVFADRYGDLGQLAGTQLSLGVGNPGWYGESLALWEREIAAMGRILGAWEQRGKADEVRKEVNERLRGHVNPHIRPPDVDEGYRVVFIPDSLLAALYVLFALEVAKSKDDAPPRVCANCQEVFAPSRRDQQYCSGRCRSNASYHRVKAKAGLVRVEEEEGTP